MRVCVLHLPSPAHRAQSTLATLGKRGRSLSVNADLQTLADSIYQQSPSRGEFHRAPAVGPARGPEGRSSRGSCPGTRGKVQLWVLPGDQREGPAVGPARDQGQRGVQKWRRNLTHMYSLTLVQTHAHTCIFVSHTHTHAHTHPTHTPARVHSSLQRTL